MNIKDVTLGPRVRKSLGDITGLAQSIAKLGLLQPIVVDQNGVLICGHRRLEACKQLGWQMIDERRVQTGAETIDALLMESDENEQRKPFTPSEAIAMKRIIEGKYREEARKRAEAGRACGTESTPLGYISQGSKTRGITGRAREKLAEAIGLGSEFTVRGAEKVVDKGVPELIDAMDNGDIPINTAVKLSTLTQEEQRIAVAGGKAAMRQAAREVSGKAPPTAPSQKQAKPIPPPVTPIPMHEAPQMSALVQRAKIMAAMDYLIATDPQSLPVLHEIMDRCQSLINRFTLERKSR